MGGRLIFVCGSDSDDRVTHQMRRLAADTKGARRRRVGYLEVRKQRDPASLEELVGVSGEFAVVAMDEDRSVCFRSSEPVAPASIWRAIDSAARDLDQPKGSHR